MELKVKEKFVTSSKVKNFQNPYCHLLEKINENYDEQNFFDYHQDAFKNFGTPKLCTIM